MDKKCPKCGKPIYGRPALSRDGKTDICSECGILEAIASYLGYISGEKFAKENDYEEENDSDS